MTTAGFVLAFVMLSVLILFEAIDWYEHNRPRKRGACVRIDPQPRGRAAIHRDTDK